MRGVLAVLSLVLLLTHCQENSINPSKSTSSDSVAEAKLQAESQDLADKIVGSVKKRARKDQEYPRLLPKRLEELLKNVVLAFTTLPQEGDSPLLQWFIREKQAQVCFPLDDRCLADIDEIAAYFHHLVERLDQLEFAVVGEITTGVNAVSAEFQLGWTCKYTREHKEVALKKPGFLYLLVDPGSVLIERMDIVVDNFEYQDLVAACPGLAGAHKRHDEL
eukprot:m.99185 g.99185  ORF g.99185 m.99185 type:complete len:220 (-) comp22156_c0_seq1:83-742(-)